MKKILLFTLTIFFSIISNLNAQELYNYNDIYKIEDGTKAQQIKNSKSSKNLRILFKNKKNPSDKKYFSIESNIIKNSEIDKNKIITESKEKESKFSKKSKSYTSGNYLGIDFINTSLTYRDVGYNPDFKSSYTLPKYKNSFGLKYFYAINYKGFFLAPEIFFEYNNIKKHFDGDNINTALYNERLVQNSGYKFMKIHRTYGGKINVGYDITPVFSSFLFAGLSKIYYSNLNSVYSLNASDPEYPDFNFETRYDVIKATGKDPFSVIHKSKNVPFFGFGSKIKLSDHFLLNAEYLIYNNFIGKTNGFNNKEFNSAVVRNDYFEFDNKLRVVKIGLLYNF